MGLAPIYQQPRTTVPLKSRNLLGGFWPCPAFTALPWISVVGAARIAATGCGRGRHGGTIWDDGPSSPARMPDPGMSPTRMRSPSRLPLRRGSGSGRCPDCGEPSHAVHSRAVRRPADLPCLGREVRLELAVRRLYCRNPACSRLQQDGTAVKSRAHHHMEQRANGGTGGQAENAEAPELRAQQLRPPSPSRASRRLNHASCGRAARPGKAKRCISAASATSVRRGGDAMRGAAHGHNQISWRWHLNSLAG